MQRIMIIGPGSSGKSTLAIELRKKLNIPVYHLDEYYWLPGHKRPDDNEWQKIHDSLTQKDTWIIEGGYSKLIPQRAERCDTIVYLNLPRRIYVNQYFKRLRQHKNITRPGMAADNPEKFDSNYLKMIWKFGPNAHLLLIQKYIEDGTKEVFILKNHKAISEFLETIKAN